MCCRMAHVLSPFFVMLIFASNPPAIQWLPFPYPLSKVQRQPDFFVAFQTELDKSQCSAEFFFEYVWKCWSMCKEPQPEAFVVVDDGLRIEDLIR